MDDYKEYDKYLERTKALPNFSWLPDAISEIKSGTKVALDLGCGAGRDTKYLLERGFTVTAVDRNPNVAKYLDALPHQERLHFVNIEFKDFKFPAGAYDIINAQSSLPYAEKDHFDSVFAGLAKSLKPGGVFVGQLFSVKDDWFKLPTSRTKFHSEEEAKNLFAHWDIVAFEPHEYDTKSEDGTMKHWHIFHILARKK